LILNSVLIDSINWFEINFFNSESINGPIRISFMINYMAILISLGLLFIIILLLISYSAKFFAFGQKKIKENLPISDLVTTSRPKMLFQIIKILFYIGSFIINWEIFETFFGLLGIFYASLNISLIYALIAFRIYYKKLKREGKRFRLKVFIQKEFNFKIIIYPILCNVYFIGIYLIFAYSYPFAFIFPSNYLVSIVLAETFFPIYFSMEILYRKVIYPQLTFIKSERKKSYLTIILTIYILINLISFTSDWAFFPSVLFTYLILLIVAAMNTLIWERTKVFSAVILSSFNIVQLFFASVIGNAFGIGAALHLFIEL